jgi:colanic acid/amylovoran/stewartan biosynthesis glycosyltransferase WcaL/AmsK/CpsK
VKVALVVNSFPVVSETFIDNHAAGLRAHGVDVTVVTADPANDAAMLAAAGGHQFDGAVRSIVLGRDPGRTLRALTRRGLSARDWELGAAARTRYGTTRRAVRAWLIALALADFDLVHLEYSGLAVAYADALPLLRPARLVVSCRGTQERIVPLIDAVRAARLRELFAIVDRVHCVSADMLRTCVSYGLDPARAFVNRPAIDPRRFTRSSPLVARTTGPYRLISTGRLHWAKGLEFALLAVRGLVDRGLDVHYEIIGGGPEHDRLVFAVHDLGLAGRVTLRGRRSAAEVRAALETADVYVLSSVSEGVSNAALEAMAMELPVVTTNAGGMPEVIRDGVEGRVVPSRSPAAMAAAIAGLLANPSGRVALGRAARRRVENELSIDRQIAVFMAEYEALVPGAEAV